MSVCVEAFYISPEITTFILVALNKTVWTRWVDGRSQKNVVKIVTLAFFSNGLLTLKPDIPLKTVQILPGHITLDNLAIS